MTAFIVRRLMQAVLVVFLVVTFVFFLIRVSGDPASLGVSLDLNRTPEEIRAEYLEIRHEMGLDRPLAVQYFLFWGRTLKGDFGYSFRYGVPVTKLIRERLPNSLRLGAAATALGLAIGLPLGIIAAVKRGTLTDNIATTLAVIGMVIPQFWLGIMLIILFSVELGILPTSGTGSWKHIILPALTLSTSLIAVVARIGRSGMLEALSQDYIRTARAKGLGERLVILRHALRNGSISIITVVVSSLPNLIGTVIVVEVVFSWPGVGNLMAQAVANRDFPVVFLDVLLFSVLTVVVFLVMDLLYAVVDPRIRYK
ncbi:MAG: ABC transporter permease [SAR202 cluster bacterium]|nr:ABC transporter permease [SAR202 cluster bacterium]